MQHICASHAPEAIGAYSQAVKVQGTVYLSGQIGLNPQTMQMCSDEVAEQVRQVFTNLQAVCKSATGDLKNIVKLTVYLADIADSAVVNSVMQEFFVGPFPARAMLEVARLPKDAKVEIDAIMVVVDN